MTMSRGWPQCQRSRVARAGRAGRSAVSPRQCLPWSVLRTRRRCELVRLPRFLSRCGVAEGDGSDPSGASRMPLVRSPREGSPSKVMCPACAICPAAAGFMITPTSAAFGLDTVSCVSGGSTFSGIEHTPSNRHGPGLVQVGELETIRTAVFSPFMSGRPAGDQSSGGSRRLVDVAHSDHRRAKPPARRCSRAGSVGMLAGWVAQGGVHCGVDLLGEGAGYGRAECVADLSDVVGDA